MGVKGKEREGSYSSSFSGFFVLLPDFVHTDGYFFSLAADIKESVTGCGFFLIGLLKLDVEDVVVV